MAKMASYKKEKRTDRQIIEDIKYQYGLLHDEFHLSSTEASDALKKSKFNFDKILIAIKEYHQENN